MAFQSLYRRYRPRRFSEVLGQDHATTALRNSVRDERVAHAYLFCGPRGTGKTSTARLLAKVLNCAAPVDGEPCGECEACSAVEQGILVDWLQELDAASNNRVEAMRELLERVPFGTSGNRKVIILDEVHMLSAGAANALLKTLEEPPEHVVFVLATTDPQKVLPTIQSRTQKFEFRLLPAEILADHVRHVIDDADLGLGEDAVEEAVRRGRGSARDALSALDQIAAAGGVVDAGVPVEGIVEGLADADVGAVLAGVAEAIEEGQDPRAIATTLVDRLRDAFLEAMRAPALSTAEADRARAADLAAKMAPARLTSALEAVGSALVDMRQAPDPRIPLEVALVRLCSREASSIDGLIARIEALESAASGVTGSAPEADPPTAADAKSGRASAARERLARTATGDEQTAEPVPVERPPLGRRPPQADTGTGETPPAASTGRVPSRDELALAWADEILPELPPPARALFKAGRFVESGGPSVRFALPNQPHRDNCDKRRGDVERALTARFGSPVTLELVVDEDEGSRVDPAGPDDVDRPTNSEEEMIDPETLIDAGEAPSTVERLTDAFPGAELIESDADGG